MSHFIEGRSVDRTTSRTEKWELDMSVFWTGSKRSGEPFRGRPELASLVVPAFADLHRSNARSSAVTNKSHFGLFFQFLDDQEEIARTLLLPHDPLAIDTLTWTELEAIWPHFINWLKARPGKSQYIANLVACSVFKYAHQQASQRGETEKTTLDIYVYFQQKRRDSYGGDVLSLGEGARVFRALARCWRDCLRVINTGRVASAEGRDPCAGSSGVHRWEGGLWADTSNRLWLILNDLPFGEVAARPDKQLAILDGMHDRCPEPRMQSPLSRGNGLWAHVPSVLLTWKEMALAMAMVCIKIGMSPDAVAAMPVSGWYRPNPLHPDSRVVIVAPKRIPGEQLTASSSITRPTDAYQIIQMVIHLTEPLRARAHALAKKTGDRRLAKLARLVWIYPAAAGGIASMADKKTGKREGSAFLTKFLEERGVARDDGRPIQFSFAIGRDLWASFAYHRSGFSHVVAAKALGHSTLKTLLHYLEKRQQMVADRIRLIELQGQVLADLAKGKYDPKSLRRAKSGPLSSKGLRCVAMYSPPADADPGNPGNRICRRQRCWFCSEWYATLESLPHLLRTIADLQNIRAELIWALWQTSDYPIILAVCEHIVGKFHPDHLAAARVQAANMPPIMQLTRFLGKKF